MLFMPAAEMALFTSDCTNRMVYAWPAKLWTRSKLTPVVFAVPNTDYGRLEKIESIIGDRWKYVHGQCHSVGFLLNPAFQHVELSSEKMSPYRDELMQDFEDLCTRRLADVEKAAQALVDFQKCKDAAYFSP